MNKWRLVCCAAITLAVSMSATQAAQPGAVKLPISKANFPDLKATVTLKKVWGNFNDVKCYQVFPIFTVTNIGNTGAKDSYAHLYTRGKNSYYASRKWSEGWQKVGSTYHKPLDSGENQTVSYVGSTFFFYRVCQGKKNHRTGWRLVADPEKIVAERNETNNVATKFHNPKGFQSPPQLKIDPKVIHKGIIPNPGPK